MRQKIVSVISALILFLFVFVFITQLGYTVQWSPEMRLTWDYEIDACPSIAQTVDGKIWVVWHSYRNGKNNPEIYYKVYNESLVHPWSSEIRLTNNASKDVTPSIMQALDGTIWVVWRSDRTGNDDICFKTYNGSTWSSDEQLTTDSSNDIEPSIMQTTNGTIWVVWSSNRTGDFEIYYKTSSDNGETWTQERLTTYPSARDGHPSIMQAADGRIWIVWVREANIFYTIYNGTAWSSAETVTNHPDGDSEPSIMQAKNGTIWVIWSSDRSPNANIDLYYNVYNVSWSEDTRLTTDDSTDQGPSILQDMDDTIWIAWYSNRAYNMDIYYKTNLMPDENDVSVFSVLPNTPTVTQGKNAFIEVVTQNKGTLAQTFQVSCYVDAIPLGSKTVSLDPGQLNITLFTWDTSGFPVGPYVLMANASEVSGEINTEDNTYVDGILHVVTHDVAVMDVTPSQPVAHKGYTTTVYIYVKVKNEGNFTETFSVTAYYNYTAIATQPVSGLAPSAETTLTFPWNVGVFPYSFWNISARAGVVVDENDMVDNFLKDGTVTVTIAGDVDGSKAVNLLDLGMVSAHWYEPPILGPDGYDLDVDINQDGKIDIYDAAIVNAHWEQFW